MTVSSEADHVGWVVRRARLIARHRRATEATTTDLLLALLSDGGSRTASLIAERGGWTYVLARKRFGPLPHFPDEDLTTVVRHYGVSARLRVVASFATVARGAKSVVQLIVSGRAVAEIDDPRLSDAASTALSLTRAIEPQSPQPAHLLAVLASTPGGHLRILEIPAVAAAAARREVGIAHWTDRALLVIDGPRYRTRRIRGFLRRRIARSGIRSPWLPVYVAWNLIGLLWALFLFGIFFVPTAVLYVFLWPGAVLVNGVRRAVALALRCRVRARRWYEIPGGETEILNCPERGAGTRLATIVLVPRLIAFAFAVATIFMFSWRVQSLGLLSFPLLYRRPDILTSSATVDFLQALLIFGDAFSNRDTVAGIGLLAGLGAGVLSMPTYREIHLVRLSAAREGPLLRWVVRPLTRPALVLTGLFAFVEAFLPLRPGPLYLTVYVVPLFFASLTAILLIVLTG